MGWLEPVDEPGRTYLRRSPNFAGMQNAADRDVEEVEQPQVHRQREQRIADGDADRDDPSCTLTPSQPNATVSASDRRS